MEHKPIKQCYVCDATLYGSKPERINPFADDDEVNNELCYRCHTEAVNEFKGEEEDRKYRYRQAWGVCEEHPNCECCTY